MTETGVRRLRIWDVPTRLFHWLLVALFGVQWYTGEVGGYDLLELHVQVGYVFLGLLVFRVLWGIFGSRSARFADFVRGPGAVIGYLRELLRGDHRLHLGHNPAGGWMVVLMLALLLFQAGSGLFANDDILTEGPLAPLVGKSMSDWLTGLHHLGFDGLLVLAGLHVAAILFYRIRYRDNLVLPMLTGRRVVPEGTDATEVRFAPWWRVVVAAIVAAAAVWGVVRLGGG